MAGLITHLVIAKEMLKLIPEGIIGKPELFYLGNLAPDAVHARQGYERAYKKHSHFRDDIQEEDLRLPEDYKSYHDRLADFILSSRNREDGLLDFYRGYVTHIITDELYVMSIREEFCKTMEQLGIGQYDKAFIDYIVGDMNRNDVLLVSRYEGMNEIRDIVENVEPLAVEGYISKQEMNTCRDWMIYERFHKKHELSEPTFISYERTLDFIHTASGEIVRRLSEGTKLPKML